MAPNAKNNPVKPIGLKGVNSPKGVNGGNPNIQCNGNVCHIVRPAKPSPQKKPVGAAKPVIKPPQKKPVGAAPPKGNPAEVINHINDNNFEEKVGKRAGLTMLFFHLDQGCSSCQLMKPVVKKLKAYYKNRLFVGDVEVLRHGDNKNLSWLLWSGWNPKFLTPIAAYPTFIFFKRGKEVGHLLGIHDEKEMISLINGKLGVK